jgi:transcriptional regulator with PAS, ATPase and Fis domain
MTLVCLSVEKNCGVAKNFLARMIGTAVLGVDSPNIEKVEATRCDLTFRLLQLPGGVCAMRFDSALPRCSPVIGDSEPMRAVREVAGRVAKGDAKVLITGESGVGKDIIAQYIHQQSLRAGRPFVTVNCAAIPETLLESELFGHVKGSFTGAYRDKVGRFQLAHRGTVFLDELGETSLRMQALLLRFLESGEVYAVGSERLAATVDVRVIAATNRELDSLIKSGQFREDLLYRVKVVHLHVPPLRERMDDLTPLIAHLMERIGRPLVFTDAALEHLMTYDWPGNVRELLNVLEQLRWIVSGDLVHAEDLPAALRQVPRRRRPDPSKDRVDALYEALTCKELTFWGDVYPRFQQRDMTREELRALVRRGLEHAGGSYRAMLTLFGISPKDYKRLLNFLQAHDCALDFRSFRPPRDAAPARFDS